MTDSRARAELKLTQNHAHTHANTYLASSSPNLFTDTGLQISKRCGLFGEFLLSHVLKGNR